MIKYILLAIFFLGIVSCGQRLKHETNTENTKVADFYKPNYTVNQLNEKLELSLKEAKIDSIEQIFIDWNKLIKPNSKDFISQNDTIKAVFDAYREFYKPLDLLKLGEWEWGNRLNSKCKYVVVQNNIFYSVIAGDFDDVDENKFKMDSIENFRPPINLSNNKVLYLTKEYSESINKFLGKKSSRLGEGGIMNPSRPIGESEKRYEILRPFIPILHGHWGGYWHLETHPEVSLILFNKDLTIAKFNFRVGYQGGEATLIKSTKGWTIKEAKATWIE